MKRSLLILVWLVLFSCAQELIGQTKSPSQKEYYSIEHQAKKKELMRKAIQQKEQLAKANNKTNPSKLSRATKPQPQNLNRSKVKQKTPPPNQSYDEKIKRGVCDKLNYLNSLPKSHTVDKKIKKYEAYLAELNKQ